MLDGLARERKRERRGVNVDWADCREFASCESESASEKESGGATRALYFVSWNSSRPMSMRRISDVPAPISYSFASRSRRPVG